MNNEPPLSNTAPAYPYDNFSPYPQVPFMATPPPPPPTKQRNTKLIVAYSISAISIALALVLAGMLIAQQRQGTTIASTPTTQAGELSKTPLIEQDNQGNHLCYVITKGEANILAVLSNPDFNTVFGDCETFIGQGSSYYSTTPVSLVAGDALQCEGWGTDNTFWKIEAPFNNLNTILMCNDLKQVVPPTQG